MLTNRLRAGELRHRLTIQMPTAAAPGTYGEQALTWGTYATVWGKVEPVSGTERFSMGQERGDVTHAVTIRCCAGVKPNMRVTFTRHSITHTLKIVNVLTEAFRDAAMTLLCSEADIGGTAYAGYSTLTFAGAVTDDTAAADSDTLDVTTNCTIEFWMKHSGTVSATQCIMAKYAATPNFQWRIDLTTQGKMGFYTDTAVYFMTTAAVLSDAYWHRYIIVKTGTVVTISKDGTDIPGTGSVTETLVAKNAPVTIGNRWGEIYDFAGSLACIRIWNVARTAAQSAVTASIIRLGTDYAASGLVAEWVDAGANSLTFPDRSGNGNTLTLDTSATKPTVSAETTTLPTAGGSTP